MCGTAVMYMQRSELCVDRDSEMRSRPVRLGTQDEGLSRSSPRVRGRARGISVGVGADHNVCVCTHPRQCELHAKQGEAVMMHRPVMLRTIVCLPHTLPLHLLLITYI